MNLAFEFRPYRTRFTTPMRTAHGAWTHREGIIIRLQDPSGRHSLGEIAPIPWFGTETLEAALEFCRKLGGSTNADTFADIPENLPCCQFAFGSALAQLKDHTQPPTGARAEVAFLLPAGADAIAAAARATSHGFTRLKWKVGVAESEFEIPMLRKIAEALPTGAKLRLDANGGWDRRTAWEWIDACEGVPVEFIEQPFPRGEDAELLEFGEARPGMFALDESVTPPGELWRWLEAGWPGVVVVKPSLAGDPSRLCKLLADHKADVVFSSALETTVGWHAAIRFAFGRNRNRRALGFGTGATFADDFLNPPVTTPVVTGRISVSDSDPWTHLSN